MISAIIGKSKKEGKSKATLKKVISKTDDDGESDEGNEVTEKVRSQ